MDLPLPEQPARSMRKGHCSRRSCVSYLPIRLCVDAISRDTPFKVHVRQDSPLLPIGIHLPTESDPDAVVDTTAREPFRQDTVVSLIRQAVGIGFLLQALAGQLVLALTVPAVASLTAEGHHAIAVPLCFEQAGCLLIVHPTGLPALLRRVPSTGTQACHDVHELGPLRIIGHAREPLMKAFIEGPLLSVRRQS